MRKCVKCGSEVKAGWGFCPICGGSEFLEGTPIVSEADDYERYATLSPLPDEVREDYVRRRFPQPEEKPAEHPQPQREAAEEPWQKTEVLQRETAGERWQAGVQPERPSEEPRPSEKPAKEDIRQQVYPRQESPAAMESDGLILKPAGRMSAILGSILALGFAILGCIMFGADLVELLDDVVYGYEASGLTQFREMLADWWGGGLISIVLEGGAGGLLGLCFAYLRIRRVPLVSQVLAVGMSFVRRIPGEFWIVFVEVMFDIGRLEVEVRDMLWSDIFVLLGCAYIGSLAYHRIAEGASEGKWDIPATPGEFVGLLKAGGLSGVGREIRLLAYCTIAYTLWSNLTRAVGLFGGYVSYSMLLILLFTVPDGLVSMAVRRIRKKKSADRGGV